MQSDEAFQVHWDIWILKLLLNCAQVSPLYFKHWPFKFWPFLCKLYLLLKVAQSCLTLRFHGLYSPWNSPGQNTEMGSCSLLQGIFPTQESNPCLPHCRWILYQLRHKGSLGILEWVTYSFSSGSSQTRNWTRVSCFTDRFFTSCATREDLSYIIT